MMKILYKRTQQHHNGPVNLRQVQVQGINQEVKGDRTETADIAADSRPHDKIPNVVSGTTPSVRYPPSLFFDAQ